MPGILFALGMLLFLAGFAFETIADRQLEAFRRDPSNKGKLFTGGLFAWSRHPHYFGEMSVWIGIGLAVIGLTGAPLALFGPLLLVVLLMTLSGPPMLGDLLKDRPGYAEWAARTPALFPRPPRRPRDGFTAPAE